MGIRATTTRVLIDHWKFITKETRIRTKIGKMLRAIVGSTAANTTIG